MNKVIESRTVGLDNKLLMDFLFAGMNCPGFSAKQRYDVAVRAHGWGHGFSISPLLGHWPFETLVPHNNEPAVEHHVRVRLSVIPATCRWANHNLTSTT